PVRSVGREVRKVREVRAVLRVLWVREVREFEVRGSRCSRTARTSRTHRTREPGRTHRTPRTSRTLRTLRSECDRVYLTGAVKKNEKPPPIVVPAPFSSSVAIVRPSEPNTRTAGAIAYDALPEISLRSRSPIGISGTSERRHARLKPPETTTFSLTSMPAPTPVNHAPRVKYPAAP